MAMSPCCVKFALKKWKKKINFSPIKNLFRKSSSTNKISFYSNTERKGQHTGWVEEVVILGSIHDPKPWDIG